MGISDNHYSPPESPLPPIRPPRFERPSDDERDALPPPSSKWLVVAKVLRAVALLGLVAGVGTCLNVGPATYQGGPRISATADYGLTLFTIAAGAILGSVIFGSLHAALGPLTRTQRSRAGLSTFRWTIGLLFTGWISLVVAAIGAVIGGGGWVDHAWGRPLRLRGRILHPTLRRGTDWTRGDRPSAAGLDAPTRAALESLWLHDAQKEHASVPAFSRISWMLAAVGAPAELMEWAHRSALEEIEHTRRCFALAAGYGGRSHSVEAMPDLLMGGLDFKGDPLVHLAIESVKDGCFLEDFNADVAAACVAVCTEPVTKEVLEGIAREERSHAEFSWSLLEWLVARGGAPVRTAIEQSLASLADLSRPTAASADEQPLVKNADAAMLRAHGRLRGEEWAALWTTRLEATRKRGRALLAEALSRAA